MMIRVLQLFLLFLLRVGCEHTVRLGVGYLYSKKYVNKENRIEWWVYFFLLFTVESHFEVVETLVEEIDVAEGLQMDHYL